jgi:hypothetical protein
VASRGILPSAMNSADAAPLAGFPPSRRKKKPRARRRRLLSSPVVHLFATLRPSSVDPVVDTGCDAAGAADVHGGAAPLRVVLGLLDSDLEAREPSPRPPASAALAFAPLSGHVAHVEPLHLARPQQMLRIRWPWLSLRVQRTALHCAAPRPPTSALSALCWLKGRCPEGKPTRQLKRSPPTRGE